MMHILDAYHFVGRRIIADMAHSFVQGFHIAIKFLTGICLIESLIPFDEIRKSDIKLSYSVIGSIVLWHLGIFWFLIGG